MTNLAGKQNSINKVLQNGTINKTEVSLNIYMQKNIFNKINIQNEATSIKQSIPYNHIHPFQQLPKHYSSQFFETLCAHLK